MYILHPGNVTGTGPRNVLTTGLLPKRRQCDIVGAADESESVSVVGDTQLNPPKKIPQSFQKDTTSYTLRSERRYSRGRNISPDTADHLECFDIGEDFHREKSPYLL